jgi:type VI secretion system VasD/TssJ family lipoprotein
MAPQRRPYFRHARRLACAILPALCLVALGGCKKKGPTCNPDEEAFESIRLVVGPADQINVDTEGNPRATVLRVYQLTDDRILDTVTFEQVWQDAAGAFGDLMLDEQEFVAYPGKAEVHEIKPNPDAKFIAAVAIFREPVGNTWVTDWNVPQFHGHSVCAAKKKKQPVGDPCFYVSVENNEVDGGHEPPPNFEGDGLGDLQCPGKPLLIQPPDELSPKEKKKKEREEKRKKRLEKMKKGGEDTKEGAEKAQETNEKADAAGDAATTKPEGPSVPGKD